MIAYDLDRPMIEPLLGDRAVRTFPAMMSVDSEARSWATQGAPDGATVVAGYQASPRGRSGLSWGKHMTERRSLGFAVVLRPDLAEEREGWLYLPALLALHDALVAAGASGARIEWPDSVQVDTEPIGVVGLQTQPERGRIHWAIVTVLVFDTEPPRAPLLAAVLDALDRRRQQPVAALLDDYRTRCTTLGRRVHASILPMGSASPTFTGEAVDLVDDGGLVITTDDGPRVVVVPQSLGFLDEPGSGPMGPPGVG